ncbi:MAG: hypothetical protein JO026_01705 [Patescibacteria group bacterium]|nr:hypothetical protein [Patescibacteria group bacterium]
MTTLSKIKKRNGAIVDFNEEKIVAAVGRAFFEVLNDMHAEDASAIGSLVGSAVKLRYSGTAQIPSVEEIQDLVEHALMERGYYDVAKAYIIYRYEHTKIREEEKEVIAKKIVERELLIVNKSGAREIFSLEKLRKTLAMSILPENASSIDVEGVLAQVQREVYDGIATAEIERTLIMVVRSMIERDPAYNQLAAQLTLNSLYREAFDNDAVSIAGADFDPLYRDSFVKNVKRGVELKLLDERILSFDLSKIAAALRPERDRLFKYIGVATLYDRYFISDRATNRKLETPQMLYMRVAMGIALNEKENREAWAYASTRCSRPCASFRQRPRCSMQACRVPSFLPVI